MKKLLLTLIVLCLAQNNTYAADPGYDDPVDLFTIDTQGDENQVPATSLPQNIRDLYERTASLTAITNHTRQPQEAPSASCWNAKKRKDLRAKVRKKIKKTEDSLASIAKATTSFKKSIPGVENMLGKNLFFNEDLAEELKRICQRGLTLTKALAPQQRSLVTTQRTTQELVEACTADTDDAHYEELQNAYSKLCEAAVNYNNACIPVQKIDKEHLVCVANQAQEEPALRALTCPGLLQQFKQKMDTCVAHNPTITELDEWQTLKAQHAEITIQATTLAIGIQANALNRNEISNENREVLNNFTGMLRAFKSFEKKISGQA